MEVANPGLSTSKAHAPGCQGTCREAVRAKGARDPSLWDLQGRLRAEGRGRRTANIYGYNSYTLSWGPEWGRGSSKEKKH